jgi:hypothetical protein
MADRIIYKTSDGREFDRERDGRRWQDYLDTGIFRADNGFYVGEMTRSGMLHGYGRFTFDSGDIFEGYYHYNKRQGEGKMNFADGSSYEGDYYNSKIHGKGKYTWANGAVYEGYWEDDKRHGKGKYTGEDGEVYEGDYVNGKRHGEGKCTNADGSVKEGYFYEGDFIGNDLADFVKIKIEKFEKEISEYVSQNGYCWESDAEKWEELTGRKMTKEDMKRIAGKTFKIKKPDSDSSSSTTSAPETRGEFIIASIFQILWAIIGAILGGMLLKFIPTWIGVVGGGIVGFFFAPNKKKLIFIGIIAVVVVLLGKNIIGFIGNKSPKPQTTETTQSANTNPTAEITKNVNFRKGPSTNDEVIRQLKQGDIVILTGEVSGGWTQVTRDGEKGWVSNEFLKVWDK